MDVVKNLSVNNVLPQYVTGILLRNILLHYKIVPYNDGLHRSIWHTPNIPPFVNNTIVTYI
jgi:hypothetical protein